MATVTATKLSPAALVDAIKREPLIGVTAAARMLGIKPPNFNRDAAPHLLAVPVEGSASVYFRSEVRQLAREWARKREKRSSNGNG